MKSGSIIVIAYLQAGKGSGHVDSLITFWFDADYYCVSAYRKGILRRDRGKQRWRHSARRLSRTNACACCVNTDTTCSDTCPRYAVHSLLSAYVSCHLLLFRCKANPDAAGFDLSYGSPFLTVVDGPGGGSTFSKVFRQVFLSLPTGAFLHHLPSTYLHIIDIDLSFHVFLSTCILSSHSPLHLGDFSVQCWAVFL